MEIMQLEGQRGIMLRTLTVVRTRITQAVLDGRHEVSGGTPTMFPELALDGSTRSCTADQTTHLDG
jgi:hypothetical protein